VRTGEKAKLRPICFFDCLWASFVSASTWRSVSTNGAAAKLASHAVSSL
jgi:hypothetical protein